MSEEGEYARGYREGWYDAKAQAADRVAALEFEVEHERYNVEKTAQEAAERIKVLEAALKEAGEMWIRKDNRIEALTEELRKLQNIIDVFADRLLDLETGK
jgi:hypothetical protein